MAINRRSFIKTGFAGAVGLSILPSLQSCTYLKRLKPGVNDTIRFGVIGLGRRTVNLVNGFHQIPGVKIVAGCDVYGIKRRRFEKQVKEHQQEKNQRIEADTYEDYKDILLRRDIDAVIISTPDHWHALQTIDACRAGKDIYLEKPLTFTIKEGIRVVEAVRNNNVILGVGSQQRSDPVFQYAVKTVQDGRLGKVNRIQAWVGDPPIPYDLPREPVPDVLNWDKWLGPAPYVHFNNDLNPPISLDPPMSEQLWGAWRWYKELGGGFLTDWGSHHFDIAQWAVGKENSGPVEIIPAGYNGHEYITFLYEDGLEMVNQPYNDEKERGIKFWGEDGWLEVSRSHFSALDDSLQPPEEEEDPDAPYEARWEHLVDFIDAVRSRREPVAPVEAGHRSCTVGTLGNIATWVKRPVRWDPVNERFVNDPEAEKYFHREYRNGYALPSPLVADSIDS